MVPPKLSREHHGATAAGKHSPGNAAPHQQQPEESKHAWWCLQRINSIVVPEPRYGKSLPHLRRERRVNSKKGRVARSKSTDSGVPRRTSAGTMMYAFQPPSSRIVTSIAVGESRGAECHTLHGVPPSPASSNSSSATGSCMMVAEEDLGFGSFRRRRSSFDVRDRSPAAQAAASASAHNPQNEPQPRARRPHHLDGSLTFAPASGGGAQSTPRGLKSFRMRLSVMR